MRTSTQEAVLSAYSASIAKRTPRDAAQDARGLGYMVDAPATGTFEDELGECLKKLERGGLGMKQIQIITDGSCIGNLGPDKGEVSWSGPVLWADSRA